MQQEREIDTYCVNPECIKNKTSFFHFTMDNSHIIQNHEVGQIHSMQIAQMYANIKNSNGDLLDQDKKNLMKRIDGYVDEFCQKMTTFFKGKYLSNFGAQSMEELNKLKFDDPNVITKRLKQEDYEMLDEVVNMRNKTIPKYPFHSFYQKKIEEVDITAKKQIYELYQAFQKIIDVTFQCKDDFIRIANGEYQELDQENKKEIKKILKIDHLDEDCSPMKTRHGFQNGYQKEIQNSQDYLFPSEMSDSQDPRKRARPKKKFISKAVLDKKPKTHEHPKQKALQRTFSGSQIKCEEQISELNSEEIIVHRCKRVDLTFEFIKNKYKNIKGLHIFSYKMATKEYLRKIFKEFKNLVILTLNCSHDFEYGILTELQKENLMRMEKLELKWDYDLFFKENQILKFFPTMEPKNIEQYNRVYLPTYLLQIMKSNRSLVLNSEKKIANLRDTNFNFSKIETLHFFKAKQDSKETIHLEPLVSLIKNNLTELRTLNLSNIEFSANGTEFKDLIVSNPNIKNVNISYCQMSESTINRVIQILSYLPKLARFALTQKPGEQKQIFADNIFALTNLRELYLSSTTIVEKTNRDITNSTALRGLSKLKKLTHLSLYCCNPVFCNFIQYIDPEVLQNLQFLNVGVTEVDDDFIKYFPKLKKLLYLNMDEVRVTGQGFLKAVKDFLYQNMSYPPLKYLSIEETRKNNTNSREWSYSIQEMKQIGAHLPQLTYLQITECRNLISYDFAQFKKLSTLALSRWMAQNMSQIPAHIQKIHF